jgi:hypothetical protein
MATRPSLRKKIRTLNNFSAPWGFVPEALWRNPQAKIISATFRAFFAAYGNATEPKENYSNLTTFFRTLIARSRTLLTNPKAFENFPFRKGRIRPPKGRIRPFSCLSTLRSSCISLKKFESADLRRQASRVHYSTATG